MNPKIQLYNCDNLELMATLPDGCIDVICIDPPYLYLKNQKLERAFLEFKFFSELERLLTKDGFVIMFGRGKSFYRWNNLLASFAYHKKSKERGFLINVEDGVYYFKGQLVDESDFKYVFDFKEEIIWDKSYSSSPLMAISRVHETVCIFSKGVGCVNRCKVHYLEMKKNDVAGICQDIKRMRNILNNPQSLQAVENYLTNNNRYSDDQQELSTTISGGVVKCQDRSASVMAIIKEGLNEKTIIKEVRDHYSAIHPTQKPVRLLERLLALVIPQDKPRDEIVVADFFAGSMSCMEAVNNMGMQGIATEIDPEYFQDVKNRIEILAVKPAELFA